MVEPVTTAAVASTAATAAAPAAATAGTLPPAVAGIAESTGNWLMNAITAPFRWVGSIIAAPFQAVASIPRNLLGAVTGAAKNVFSFSNVPLAAALTGALTFIKTTFPEGWRDTLAMFSDKATATAQINEVAKDGLTGVAFDSAKQGLALTAGISAITGAIEGGGVLAGVGLIGGVGALAYNTLIAPATPKVAATATPAAKPEKAKA